MSSNTFCRHLSNGFRIYIRNNKITWHPCCYWVGPELEFENLDVTRKKLNTSVAWAHKECWTCRSEEKYKPGYRAASFKIIPEGLPDTKVGWLDIQADMTCNGGCLICGPGNSSFWQSELAKYNEHVPYRSPNSELYTNIDKVFDSIDVSELANMQFLGGEPFLSDVDEYSLKKIPNPERCQIQYTTNGSIYPSASRIKLWEKFKNVYITLSIDGVGSKFEYLRYPLKWNTIENNVRRLINETDEKVHFHINHTVTPFNAYYYQDLVDWVDETFPKERFTRIHVHPAYGIMSPNNCGSSLRTLIADRYGMDHTITKIVSGPMNVKSNFWEYITKWDQRRNQNWQTVFPELVDAMKQ